MAVNDDDVPARRTQAQVTLGELRQACPAATELTWSTSTWSERDFTLEDVGAMKRWSPFYLLSMADHEEWRGPAARGGSGSSPSRAQVPDDVQPGRANRQGLDPSRRRRASSGPAPDFSGQPEWASVSWSASSADEGSEDLEILVHRRAAGGTPRSFRPDQRAASADPRPGSAKDGRWCVGSIPSPRPSTAKTVLARTERQRRGLVTLLSLARP